MPRSMKRSARTFDDVGGFELASHPDSEALARELFDHAQHSEGSTIMRAIRDEVIGPHVIGVLRTKPYA